MINKIVSLGHSLNMSSNFNTVMKNNILTNIKLVFTILEQTINTIELMERPQQAQTVEPLQKMQLVEAAQKMQPVEAVEPVEAAQEMQSVEAVEPVEPVKAVKAVEPLKKAVFMNKRKRSNSLQDESNECSKRKVDVEVQNPIRKVSKRRSKKPVTYNYDQEDYEDYEDYEYDSEKNDPEYNEFEEDIEKTEWNKHKISDLPTNIEQYELICNVKEDESPLDCVDRMIKFTQNDIKKSNFKTKLKFVYKDMSKLNLILRKKIPSVFTGKKNITRKCMHPRIKTVVGTLSTICELKSLKSILLMKQQEFKKAVFP